MVAVTTMADITATATTIIMVTVTMAGTITTMVTATTMADVTVQNLDGTVTTGMPMSTVSIATEEQVGMPITETVVPVQVIRPLPENVPEQKERQQQADTVTGITEATITGLLNVTTAAVAEPQGHLEHIEATLALHAVV